MSHDIKLVYTHALLKRAVFAFWRRSLGFRFVLSVTLLAAWTGKMIARGNSDWGDGMILALLLVYLLFLVIAYVLQYRHATEKLRDMGNQREATMHAAMAEVRLTSNLGTLTMNWSTIKEVWQFADFWLLVYSPNQFSTLPLADVPEEAKQFLLERVQASGGKIS